MKEKYDKKRVLFVGLNTVDLQFVVNHYPQSNTKTKAHHNEIFVGGPATNAAIACAYLGSKVDLYTPIGKHTLADYILDDLSRYSIRIIDPISDREGKPVFASIITSQQNGERTVFSYHPEFKVDINHDLNFNIKDYSLVLFDGFHPELALEIAKGAKKNDIPTVLDGGSWKPGLDELLKYIDVAICSNDFKVPGANDSFSIISSLHSKGINSVAITHGEKDILCSHAQQKNKIEVQQVEVADTLGAGDIFHGAFCHYFDESYDFLDSLKLASQIAAESCKSIGTRAWMNQ